MAGMLATAVSTARAGFDWLAPELRRIENDRVALQEKLTALPPAPAPQITQRLGWHSDYAKTPDAIEWVELNLGHAEPVE